MRCNSPSPRPAAFPPPSPPPMSLGIVRGFTGTMQPSDFSSACMPIVRLLPSWAGPACGPETDEISQVPTKGRHHVQMGSPTARGSSSASRLRGEDVAFRPTERRQHLGIRPVSQLNIPARGLPCERFKLSLTASPCITRGRGGWLGLTPWKTCTSYPLASLLGALWSGSRPPGPAASNARQLDPQ
jgi:hypothetical protein